MSTSMKKAGSPKDYYSSAGEERFIADKRQFAALLFALGICVTFQPLAGVVSAIGPNGTTASSGLPLAGLISGLILVVVGSLGMFTGFLGTVFDKYNNTLTLVLIAAIQLTWMPFLTDLTAVGKNTHAGVGFVPGGTEQDNRFVGAMGMIGILTYASSFVGSFAFMAFCLYAYQTGKSSERAAGYFAGRLVFYSSLVVLAGISQLLLGAYVMSRFGGGPLSPPIGVAMYIVHFPEINVFVGLAQLLVGIFGVLRRYGIFNGGKDDHRFQIALFFMWMCMLSMQILTQVGYAPGGELAPAAPTIACLSLGLSVAPAFLDYKMRTLPQAFPADYYTVGAKVDNFEKAEAEMYDKMEVGHSTMEVVDQASMGESSEFDV